MRVSVNVLRGNPNAVATCEAMARGISACGDVAIKRHDTDWDMAGYDAAVLWGYVDSCQRVINECKQRGMPWVFIDNGYALRKTHFKVAVNDRHPTAYIAKLKTASDRFEQWGVEIQPWQHPSKPDAPILLAGMSGKSAWSWGLEFEEWERATADKLRQHSNRPIVYRPKANSLQAKPIPGTIMERDKGKNVNLGGVHCVVTHHSNIGCDAMLQGVPVFTRYGAALPLAASDSRLDLLECPIISFERDQWAANLAYCQWSKAEMASGACWRNIRWMLDGLVDAIG